MGTRHHTWFVLPILPAFLGPATTYQYMHVNINKAFDEDSCLILMTHSTRKYFNK